MGGAGGWASHGTLAPRLLALPCPGCLGQKPLAQSLGLPAHMGSVRAHPLEGSAPPQVRPRGWGRRAYRQGPQWLCIRNGFLGPKPCVSHGSEVDAGGEALGGLLQWWSQQTWQVLWPLLPLTQVLQAPLCPPGPPTAACPSSPHLTPAQGTLFLSQGSRSPVQTHCGSEDHPSGALNLATLSDPHHQDPGRFTGQVLGGGGPLCRSIVPM